MKFVIVILSHGSVLADAGELLENHKARLRKMFPRVRIESAYLNYGAPLLPEVVAELRKEAFEKFIIIPYFLVEGKFFRDDIERLMTRIQEDNPAARFLLEKPIGDSPHLRNAVADSISETHFAKSNQDPATAALLILLHGSPHPESNEPAYNIVRQIREQNVWHKVLAGHIDCNSPDIPTALLLCKADNVRSILVVPWFLHNGKHVKKDIPDAVRDFLDVHPLINIEIAPPVGKYESVTLALHETIVAALST